MTITDLIGCWCCAQILSSEEILSLLFLECLLIDKLPSPPPSPFENASHHTASPVIPELGLTRLPKRNGWVLFKEIYPRSRRSGPRGHAFGNLATRIITPGSRGCNKFSPGPTSAYSWNSLGDVLPFAFFIFAFRAPASLCSFFSLSRSSSSSYSFSTPGSARQTRNLAV